MPLGNSTERWGPQDVSTKNAHGDFLLSVTAWYSSSFSVFLIVNAVGGFFDYPRHVPTGNYSAFAVRAL
jgi:hypothetical protein